MDQDWAAVGATLRLNTYIHTYIHTYICCKGAVSDPLGTRIGIEFEGAVRRCCSSWKSSQQISSEPSTAYIHTSENTEEITIDQWKGNKKPDACFPMCCAHARCVSRMFFSPERIRDCTTHCIKRCCQSQPWPVLSIADEFQ